MPLALKLIKLATEYDETTWDSLRSGSMLHMLGQARLLARIIHALNGKRPSLGCLYFAAWHGDGQAFAINFERLYLIWEESVVDVDSKETMLDNTA